jgi:hypothetical protein
MKKTFSMIIVAALLLGFASVVVAEVEPEALSTVTSAPAAEEKKAILTGTLETSFTSKYIGEISGATDFKRSAIQSAITITHEPTGAYLKVWNSYALQGGHPSTGDEIDPIIIGIAREIEGFKLDLGYAFYDLVRLDNTKGDLHAVYASIETPKVLTVSLFVAVENDFAVNREILRGGFMWRYGLKKDLDIMKQTFNLSLSGAGHASIFGTRPEALSSARLSIATTFKVYKNLEATPFINFQKRLGYSVANGGLTENQIYGGLKISFPFDILK